MQIDGWLSTLGIATRCQWDVLAFLYRHQISLVGATLIAHLLRYAIEPVVGRLRPIGDPGAGGTLPNVPQSTPLSVRRTSELYGA
jgi:hypothetical protein